MACKILRSRHSFFLLIGLTAPGLMFGQVETVSTKNVLQMSRADQVAFLKTTMDQGFPMDRADPVTMLVINRSDIAVPVILARLEAVLSSQDTLPQFIDTAVEIIAYAGDEHALRAISHLLSIDEARFGRYIGRTLGNAANWRNPFTLAYYAVEMSDSRITELAVKWVEDSLESSRRQRFWAEAMLEKYRRVPTESDWETDPIASRLTVERTTNVKRQVLFRASEVHQQRVERK